MRPEALVFRGNTWTQQLPAVTATTIWLLARRWAKAFTHVFPPSPPFPIPQRRELSLCGVE